MRVAFCFMSNKRKDFNKMAASLIANVQFDLEYVTSHTKNALFNPPAQSGKVPGWNIEYRTYYSNKATDYFSMRQDSLAMAKSADLIYVGDDDFFFKEGSAKVIDECCKYMDENKSCGAIYLSNKFGDEHLYHDNKIYIINNGHLSTNRGIILRNRNKELMDNRLYALGANEDFVIGFTCLLQGYYLARKLYVPIEHTLERNEMSEHHTNLNYNLEYIKRYGIMSKVNKVIGEWTDHNIWPENIFKYYWQASHVNGFNHKYLADGEICSL